MSIVCLLVAIYMSHNEFQNVEAEFFVIWALFSIADALWFGRAKK